jgi:hypothetical protein
MSAFTQPHYCTDTASFNHQQIRLAVRCLKRVDGILRQNSDKKGRSTEKMAAQDPWARAWCWKQSRMSSGRGPGLATSASSCVGHRVMFALMPERHRRRKGVVSSNLVLRSSARSGHFLIDTHTRCHRPSAPPYEGLSESNASAQFTPDDHEGVVSYRELEEGGVNGRVIGEDQIWSGFWRRHLPSARVC